MLTGLALVCFAAVFAFRNSEMWFCSFFSLFGIFSSPLGHFEFCTAPWKGSISNQIYEFLKGIKGRHSFLKASPHRADWRNCGLGDGAAAAAAVAEAAAGAAGVAEAAATGLKGSCSREEMFSHPTLYQSQQIVSCDMYLHRTAARGWWRWRPRWPVCWQMGGKSVINSEAEAATKRIKST